MNKQLINLWLVVAFFTMGLLSSCSKDKEQEPQPTQSGETLMLSLNLEATVENDGLRALEFQTGVNTLNQYVPFPKFTNGQLVPVHTIIRGNNNAYGVATINWKYSADKGRLILETRDPGNEITIANFNNDTEWYVSGLIGGVLEGTKVKFATPKRTLKGLTDAQIRTEGTSLGNLDVPYALGWTKLKLHTQEGNSFKVADASVGVFKPRGAFIGYKLGNKLTDGYTFTPTGFVVRSDAFGDMGEFELNAAPVAGKLPSWTEATPTSMMSYTFETPVSQPYASDANKVSDLTYYAWVIPTRLAESGGLATASNRIILKGTSSKYSSAPEKDYTKMYFTDYLVPTVTKGKVSHGRVHRMTARATERVGLPIEYVTERNVNATGDGFVTDDLIQDQATMGFFGFNDAVAKFTNISIGGKDYYLPSALKMSTALGGAAASLGLDFSVAKDYDVKEDVDFYGLPEQASALYRVKDEYTAYAIRHVWDENAFRSAYRYRFLDLGDPAKAHLEVSVLHLGAGFSGDITTVQNYAESVWDNAFKRKLPLTGYYGFGNVRMNHYSRALLWSSSLIIPGTARFYAARHTVDEKRITPYHSSGMNNRIPVRLWKKHLDEQ